MSNNEYFELKYLEEVNDLFLTLKELNGHYNLGLFQGIRDTPMDLFEFLQEKVQVLEEYSSDEEVNSQDYD